MRTRQQSKLASGHILWLKGTEPGTHSRICTLQGYQIQPGQNLKDESGWDGMVRGTTKGSVHNSTRLSIQPRVLESGEHVRDIYIKQSHRQRVQQGETQRRGR